MSAGNVKTTVSVVGGISCYIRSIKLFYVNCEEQLRASNGKAQNIYFSFTHKNDSSELYITNGLAAL